MYNEYEVQMSATREDTQRIGRLLIYSVSCTVYTTLIIIDTFPIPLKCIGFFADKDNEKIYELQIFVLCVCKFISMEFKCTLKSRFSNVTVQNADQYAVGESKVK